MSGTLNLYGGGQILFSSSGNSGLGTPATGYGSVFLGTDGYLRLMDDAGNIIIPGQGQGGTSGTSGTSDGSSGTSGTSGTVGTSGENGIIGTSGSSGQSSGNGTSGTCGTNGSSSSSGSSGTSGLSSPGPEYLGGDPPFESQRVDPTNTSMSHVLNFLNPNYDNLAVGAFNIYNAEAIVRLNTIIGTNNVYTPPATSQFNTIIGTNASYYADGAGTTVIGTDAAKNCGDSVAPLYGGIRGPIVGHQALGGKPGVGVYDVRGVTIVGNRALYNLDKDSGGHVAIGHESLFNLGATGSTGNSNNTCVGYRSGYDIQTGSNNTILGCTGGTAGMTGALVLSNGDNSTEINIQSSAIQSGTYSFNTRLPITIGGSTYYLLLST